MPVAVAFAVAFLGILSLAAASESDAAIKRYELNIPKQRLDTALKDLAQQTGLQIARFSDTIDGSLVVGPLTGQHSAEAALKILLVPRGLSYKIVNDRTIAVVNPKDAAPLSQEREATGSFPRSGQQEAPREGRDEQTAGHLRISQASEGEQEKAERSFSPAVEEENKIVLEEIVVTATKRAVALRDVPLSVTAITSQDIQERGYTNYADFLNAVPGVYFQDFGAGTSQIQIRGLAAAEGGVASAVATYFGETVTNVLTNFGGKPNMRLVDIDRVEVLRGPQGTLFGANSLSGVVRVIPRAPELDEFQVEVGTRGFATAHSDDASYHVEGAVNFPLVQDRLALRVVGYKDEIAGYIDNRAPAQSARDWTEDFESFLEAANGLPPDSIELPDGSLITPAIAAVDRKDINSEDTWGARATLRWQATDRLRLDLTQAIQDVRLGSEPFTEPEAGRYGQRRALDAFEQGKQGERLEISTLVLDYDWDAVSLLSATNWVEMKRVANQDITFLAEASFGTAIPWPLRDRSRGELFTQEFRVSSKGDGPFQWIAGAFYLQQDSYYSQFVGDYSCPTCLSQLLLGQDFALDVPPQKFSEQEQSSVFGEASYQIAPHWTLGVGVRYLEEDLTTLFEPIFGFLVDSSDGVQEAQPTVTASVSETNPSAYVRYEPSEDTTVYLQAARGFRSGSVNQPLPDECQAEANALGLGVLTDPDTLWNYEFGFKSVFAGGRLGINTAVYKHKWKGVQLGVGLDCGFGNGFNGGDVDGEGIELELLGRLGQGWSFNLSGSYVHNEFERINSPLVGFVVGERVAEAPQKNGSAGVQYEFLLGGQWSAFARADVVYMGDVPFKFGPGVVVKQDSFTTGSLRLGGRRGSLAVELFAENLTDERAVVVSGDPDFGGRQYLLRPREIGIELRYSYK